MKRAQQTHYKAMSFDWQEATLYQDEFCVPLTEGQIMTLLGLIEYQRWPTRWYNAPGLTRDQATDWVDNLQDRLLMACPDAGSPRCTTYLPTASIIEYFPIDPRVNPDDITDGYTFPAWYFATDTSNLVYGTKSGDVVTSVDRLPLALPPLLPPSGYPRIRVTVPAGTETVRAYFRNMFFGSLVQSTVDDDILTIYFDDTNKDVIAVPPETAEDIIIEHTLSPGVGHHIDYIVVPSVNDSLALVNFGAALVKIEVCGEGQGMDCCDDILDAIKRLDQAQSGVSNAVRQTAWNGTNPQTVNPSAPPAGANFDDSTNGATYANRDTALCIAVQRYVYTRMIDTLRQYELVGGIVGAGAAAGFLFGGPIGWIVGGAILILDAYLYQQILDAANDQMTLDEIVCELYQKLKGMTITQANFTAAVNGLTVGTGNKETAVSVLQSTGNALSNWLFFVDCLGAGYDAALAGAENTCCPAAECEYLWDFRQGSQGWRAVYGSITLGQGLYPTSLVSGYYEGQLLIRWTEPCYAQQLRVAWYDADSSNIFRVAFLDASGGYINNPPTVPPHTNGVENDVTMNTVAVPGPGTQPFYGLLLWCEKIQSSGADSIIRECELFTP